MAYSTNPNLPKARAIALQLLIREQLPLYVVANRCGVHRSTCLLYTSPSPRDRTRSRMPSSA